MEEALIRPTPEWYISMTTVPVAMVPALWDQYGGVLMRALKRNGEHWDEWTVVHELLADRMQMWLIVRDIDGYPLAVGLTRVILADDHTRTLTMLAVAGDHPDKWVGVFPIFERYAREAGCVDMMFLGPRAWRRWAEPVGFVLETTEGKTAIFHKALYSVH